MCCKIYNRQQLSALSCSGMQKAISCRKTNIRYSANVWWRKTVTNLVNHYWFAKFYHPEFLKCLVESCQIFLYHLNIPAIRYLMSFISNFVRNAKMTYYGFSENFVICHSCQLIMCGWPFALLLQRSNEIQFWNRTGILTLAINFHCTKAAVNIFSWELFYDFCGDLTSKIVIYTIRSLVHYV